MDKIKNKTAVIYIHGKGGSSAEAEHYKPLFPECDLFCLDYKSATPWEAKEEFPKVFLEFSKKYSYIILIANSIGAYLSICALPQDTIEKAFFISPIVDMERLICDMMQWAGVSECELQKSGTVSTDFGETLSWDYLCYVRSNAVCWNVPTHILYGSRDNLTSIDTITAFAATHNSKLTVMEQGEHWFHTPEQMDFLDNWLTEQFQS